MTKKQFSFMGCSCDCDNEKPHLPHVKSHYNTVCWGDLENFCTGKSGILPDGRTLKIRITDMSSGNAAVPKRCKGYYTIQ